MSKHRFYRPELDVLRLLAFLLVFFHHSAPFVHHWAAEASLAAAFGLPLFFLLSAYLITELLDRECQSTGSIHLRAFYARRILRIWPLYFAALLVDFTHAHFHVRGDFTPTHLAFYLLLAGNWYTAMHGFTGCLTMPLWSISVEEQFYLLWPPVRRLFRRRGAVIFSCIAFALAYLTLHHEANVRANLGTTVWVNSFVQFQFFATGALLALRLRGRAPAIPAWLRGALFTAALLAFFVAQNTFGTKTGMPYAVFRLVMPGYLLVNLGCTALFFSFLGAAAPARATPLVYLGKISYGLYVFHYPMLLLSLKVLPRLLHGHRLSGPGFLALQSVLALFSTVLLAHLSYRFFEAPILRFKQRFEIIRTRPA